MPKTARDTSVTAFPQVPAFAPFDLQAALSVARIQAQSFKAAMRYPIETLVFLKHRYERDVKLAEDLANSLEFGDTLDVCFDFYQQALVDYSAEAGKLAKIGSKLASEASEEICKEADTITDNIAAQTAA
ncbi:phasin family protein [Chelativorans alearense]|uniref:phasin family protein n=1 Tax=Chelativorans alearense TaxID=2681495 RepID=UPI0013D0CD8C|nr:phasin family protein [Chelativorans alearense]